MLHLHLDVGTEIKLRDIKTEPSGVFFGAPYGAMGNGSKQGLVSVAITLQPAAAEVRPPLPPFLVSVFFFFFGFQTSDSIN